MGNKDVKKFILANSKRIIGTSLALSFLFAQTVGATSSVADSIQSRGNIEYDANGDGTAEVYFHAEDLETIGQGYDFIHSKIATLDANYTTLINQTNNYKSSIITGLNASVNQKSKLAATASYTDIIAAINAIPNKSNNGFDLTPANKTTSIPAGYYNGDGKINITSAPASGKSAVTAGTMLTGYSGWVNGSQINGTMPNKTNSGFNLTPANTSTTIPEGYYNGSGKIAITSAPASGKTAVTAATMLTGYSGWVNGSQINGTMPNRGNLSKELDPNSSHTLDAGYYSGGTIKAKANTGTYTFPANSTGAKYDMGVANLNRYVDATNVYAKGKADGLASTAGTAAAGHILYNKTAWVAGSKVTGTMSDYSSSTAQACTVVNTSGRLYVKPSNAGYYTSSSSFNTGISYNPNKTVSGGAAGTVTGDGATSSSDITLASGKLVTIPAGYYSAATVVRNGGGSFLSSTNIEMAEFPYGSSFTMAKKGLCIIGVRGVNCRTPGQRSDGGYDLWWCNFWIRAYIRRSNGTVKEEICNVDSAQAGNANPGYGIKIIRELEAGDTVVCEFNAYDTRGVGGYMVWGDVGGTAAYY